MVTKDAEALRDAIVNNKPRPSPTIRRNPKEVMDEDKVIEAYKIDVKPEAVRSSRCPQVFQ